ncbi:chromate transporter [Cytobacillus depressus]|uniref:Chromate transporter n=1 Tax=Cytobacillus depressus TaxID=1602942 RepID=A0A6L3VAK2_9BACI|nr:chromate transporter [Cytobacillus depressus]KAB2338099.1 chromate transporter [Cytobacillus depressus]
MAQHSIKSLFEIFTVALKLGVTSFGGPVAHLGYFHNEYVIKRKWIDEKSYADLVALCQFLPGPASSQVGIGIGVTRGGILGGILAFLGFTLPSVIALILFVQLLTFSDIGSSGWIHGLKIVAVAVVAHAVMGMAQKLAPDLKRKAIVLFAICATLLWSTVLTQISIIVLSGLLGYLIYKNHSDQGEETAHFPLSKKLGLACIILYLILLVILPILREITQLEWIALFDSFYRSGSLVFGGGHVVLPLLEREFVPTGWLSKEAFLAGYGATQAVPGPLFTFAAYIGAVIHGWKGGMLATIAIFLPAFLLILGTLPFWHELRKNPILKGALIGVNAAVVGILIAAFYDPIWTSSILTPKDFAFAAILFSMLAFWKLPPWVIVLTGAIGGIFLEFV